MGGNPLLFLAPLNGSLAYQDRAGGGSLVGSGAVRYQPASGARTNLVKNPSAVTSAGNTWTATTGGSVARVTDSVLGPTAHRITAGVSGNSGMILWRSGSITTGVHIIRDKVAHTFAADIALVSGTENWNITWWVLDAGGNILGVAQGTTQIVLTSAGARYVSTYTPTQTGAAALCPALRHSDASAAVADIRAMTLVEGTYTAEQLPHFDGATNGGVWLDPETGMLGTAHASPSVSQAVAWVEGGTTNLVKNPSANSGTTGWQGRLSATLTRDTAYARVGVASYKIVTPNVAASEGIQATVDANGLIAGTTGQTFTVSVPLRGSGTVRISIQEYSAVPGFLTQQNGSDITLTDQWVTYSATFTISNPSATQFIPLVATPTQQSITFWSTNWQVEQKAYATSYTDGSIGTGYSWSSTAHASSSTRTVCSIRDADASHYLEARGSLNARVYPTTLGALGVFGLAANKALIGHSAAGEAYALVNGLAVSTVASEAPLQAWRYHAMDWNDSIAEMKQYRDGVLKDTKSGAAGAINFSGAVYQTNGSLLNALIGPVLIADRPLTAKERATLNARTVWGWSTLKGGSVGRLTPF